MKNLILWTFVLLALAHTILLFLNLPLFYRILFLMLTDGTALVFLFSKISRKGGAEERRARDRVSNAVIGLLHSTNGISSLQTYNDLIRRSLDDREKAEKLLDQEKTIIDEYSAKVKAIVSDMSHSFRTEKALTDITSLMEQSAEYIRLKRIRENKIPLVLDLPSTSLFGEVYPSLLKTALENIIDNSYDELLEAGKEDGAIHLTVREAGDSVELTVRDNGRGFRGIEGRVPLKSVRPGKTGRESGNGLGLFVAVEAVGECGGNLTMISSSSGLSTVITVPRQR